MESEERSWQTALREVQEETGLKASELHFVRGFKARERFSYRRGKEKIFKVVILYLAETSIVQIAVSDEHEGYGWFTYVEAKRILARYKDSLQILDRAYDFLQEKGISGGPKNPPRRNAHVPRNSAHRGESPSLPSGGEHSEQKSGS